MRWWVSFADSHRPKGQQFLGCCIVHALDIAEAAQAAWVRGINPGGEVVGIVIDAAKVASLSFSLEPYEWRLLSPVEASELSNRINAELAS